MLQFEPETVVFDLDGTLVDTAPDLTASLNAALMRKGLQPVSIADVRHMVGRGARFLIESAMTSAGAVPTPFAVSEMVEYFIDYYALNIAAMSRPFEGVEEELKRLAKQGHRLGICTNKPAALTVKLLAELSLDHYFHAVRGADSQSYRKPDPRHLLDVISMLGGAPENSVFVGDSDTDLKTARAADVPIVLVSFGYTETAARALGADIVIDRFDELPQAVLDLRSRRTL